MVTSGFGNNIRQVDDILNWESSIAGNFRRTCEYLTLLGKNWILQNPENFQFCSHKVTWSWFVISKDQVKPMPHLTQTVRDLPRP